MTHSDSPANRIENLHPAQSLDGRLRLLVERAGDIVWTVDMEMRPTYVSPAIQRYLGYTDEEARSLTMKDVFAPQSYEAAMRVLSAELTIDQERTTDPDRRRLVEVDLVHKDGHTVPFEVCYSALRDAQGRPVEVMAIARDITARKIADEYRMASARKLIAALGQTIQALAMLAELKDSYTAGHQRRVANLACAIARRMGLDEDAIEGLRLAGLIHDIGKVRVPAEILGSTRRLTPAEFELIKVHPTTGFEVLSGIDFPWPIAQAVHQHHERLDGSGYPRGLTGPDIIVEARIMAVADVVEAITSERPYRKAIGVEAALDEIARHRGVLYDAAAVDACLDVFRKDAFVFDQEALPPASVDG
ncbi:MAG: PAS domain S-box protein [Dehalococcoidia bacterium]|jgi:PAS domain S-box-containing protein/putative nucleotidyltransferase with HDIG domain|nr:PAS domain S-box protein [Dehalococcoidia bacterium]